MSRLAVSGFDGKTRREASKHLMIHKMNSGTRGIQGSALSPELHRLTPRQRSALGIPDAALALWSLVVLVAELLTDDRDGQPWQQRLEAVRSLLAPDDPDALVELNRHCEYMTAFAADDLPAWTKGMK